MRKRLGKLPFDRTTHTVHPRNREAIKALLEELKSKPLKKGRVWDEESDEKLHEGVAEFGYKFQSIANKYFSTVNDKGQKVSLKLLINARVGGIKY